MTSAATYLVLTGHTQDCGWQFDQYRWECTCGATAPHHPLTVPHPRLAIVYALRNQIAGGAGSEQGRTLKGRQQSEGLKE